MKSVDKLANVPHIDNAEFGIAVYGQDDISRLPEGRIDRGVVMICSKGSATVEHNHIPHHLTTNGIVIIFPNNIFSFVEVSDDFEMYRLQFSDDIFNEITYNLPNSFFNYIVNKPVYHVSDEELATFTDDHFRVIFHKISDTDNICRHEIVVNLLCNLFLDIYDKIVRFCNIDTLLYNRKKRLFDRFMGLLNTHPCKRDVAFFANELCITPKYLSVICTSTTGVPAKEFIDRSLICSLKQTLRTTDSSVKQIAERFGFPNAGNMCRFFKSRTGTTISAYRQETKSRANIS